MKKDFLVGARVVDFTTVSDSDEISEVVLERDDGSIVALKPTQSLDWYEADVIVAQFKGGIND